MAGRSPRPAPKGLGEFDEPMMTAAEYDARFAPDDTATLLRVRFAKGIAVYTTDFELHIVGSLWPRPWCWKKICRGYVR